MTRLAWMIALLAATPAGVAAANDRDIYTLYRSSVTDAHYRIHIATFDAMQSSDTEIYNRENCLLAARLFQQQPGVTVSYWCEPGKYRQ